MEVGHIIPPAQKRVEIIFGYSKELGLLKEDDPKSESKLILSMLGNDTNCLGCLCGFMLTYGPELVEAGAHEILAKYYPAEQPWFYEEEVSEIHDQTDCRYVINIPYKFFFCFATDNIEDFTMGLTSVPLITNDPRTKIKWDRCCYVDIEALKEQLEEDEELEDVEFDQRIGDISYPQLQNYPIFNVKVIL